MTRRNLLPFAVLAPVLVLSACGDAGLNVQGTIGVTTDGTTRSFDFPNQTRLDGTTPGRFTGSCVLRRTYDAEGSEQWGAVVELRSGGTADDDSPLTSVTIMQNTGARPDEGRVEVVLGGAQYTAVEGGCSIEIPYALPDGVVAFAGTCEVTDGASHTASVELEVDLSGCDVEQ